MEGWLTTLVHLEAAEAQAKAADGDDQAFKRSVPVQIPTQRLGWSKGDRHASPSGNAWTQSQATKGRSVSSIGPRLVREWQSADLLACPSVAHQQPGGLFALQLPTGNRVVLLVVRLAISSRVTGKAAGCPAGIEQRMTGR